MTTQTHKIKQYLEQKLNELNQFKIDLGLDRLQTVLHRLGLNDPNQKIITVGGTNGKGSTVAALCSLLTTQSISYGAFTSPHIFRFNERICVNGQQASDQEIIDAFDAIDEARQDINLSYFEYAFLTALIVFNAHQVDVIVLEVGLGGRLDACNAIDSDLAVITTIDIDHTDWLGNDIESIAREKAGIMRSGNPIVYGDNNTPAQIIKMANIIGADLYQFDKDFQIEFNHSKYSYSFQSDSFKDLNRPSIKGDWQLKNYATALTAMILLGYEISHDEVQKGLDEWFISGRLQTIQDQPLVLADVAHNRQAVSQLAHWLKSNPIEGVTRAVFSVLANKNMETWISLLSDEVDHWFVFELKGERAMSLLNMKLKLADHVSLISTFESAQDAYQQALANSDAADRIIVFGSFQVLEQVLTQ